MKIPRLLTVGDKVAIVAPAGKLQNNALDETIEVLSSWGLKVEIGKHVYDQGAYFAGKDVHRLADLQQALNNSSLAAIISARGGYGVTRILQQIDISTFSQNPKWVIGFSDITALHLQLQARGIASIHGPMGTSLSPDRNQASIDSLRTLLFEGESRIVSMEAGMRKGSVTAEVTGGNLSLIIDSLGTANEINTRNKILFIEEVGEKPYRIDRMFHQLLRAGKLNDLAGLVVGHFDEIIDKRSPFGESWQEIITNITKPFSYPLSFGFCIGHGPENSSVVMGGIYHLSVEAGKSTLVWQHHN